MVKGQSWVEVRCGEGDGICVSGKGSKEKEKERDGIWTWGGKEKWGKVRQEDEAEWAVVKITK